MGKNKLSKFSQMETFSHVFQYPYSELKEKGFPMKGKWNEEFFGNDNPIVLEVGCGKGEYTIGLAELFPDKNFIGIDIKGARMWSGAVKAIEQKLNNVAFLRTNIELLSHFFSQNEVSEIWITFPDPQMKKVNKRLTSCRFMKMYSNFIKSDGTIHLKSDSPFLYTYTKAMIEANRLNLYFDTEDLYNSALDDKILNIQTFYEQQWRSRGLSIKYIKYECPKLEHWIEPEIEIEYDSYRSFGRNRI